MAPSERRAAIVNLVQTSSAVRGAELAARFGVDVATIRRDLQKLAERGQLRRVHGGAVRADESSGLEPTSLARRIGHAAGKLIADGETVYLGPGTLSLAAARELSLRPSITVVTGSVEVAHWVAANSANPLIVIGGQVERPAMGLGGSIARNALSSLRTDHVVLELGGVSPIGGLTDDSLAQAEIDKMLLESGARTIVLVQGDRVGRVGPAFLAPADGADVLVTSRDVESAPLWDLSEQGVQIVLA